MVELADEHNTSADAYDVGSIIRLIRWGIPAYILWKTQSWAGNTTGESCEARSLSWANTISTAQGVSPEWMQQNAPAIFMVLSFIIMVFTSEVILGWKWSGNTGGARIGNWIIYTTIVTICTILMSIFMMGKFSERGRDAGQGKSLWKWNIGPGGNKPQIDPMALTIYLAILIIIIKSVTYMYSYLRKTGSSAEGDNEVDASHVSKTIYYAQLAVMVIFLLGACIIGLLYFRFGKTAPGVFGWWREGTKEKGNSFNKFATFFWSSLLIIIPTASIIAISVSKETAKIFGRCGDAGGSGTRGLGLGILCSDE